MAAEPMLLNNFDRVWADLDNSYKEMLAFMWLDAYKAQKTRVECLTTTCDGQAEYLEFLDHVIATIEPFYPSTPIET
jgi:hypothetical protein